MLRVPILKLDPAAVIPVQANQHDAGFDLYSIEEVNLEPFGRTMVRTGIAIALPEGTVGLVHPRSGLAIKQGLAVLNSPGTIDAGYRGEIKVILINLDPKKDILISPGDRIAQLVIQEFKQVKFELVSELEDSDRGSGGFGSTGR
ncbi:MAG: dUTP diphosphatase [Candidatus Nanopelagicales bacterium]